MSSLVAFIPARGGSERIPSKNIRELNGHPLIAYAIAGAKRAGIFDGIYVSTEDPEIMAVAIKYGAEVIKRPKLYATAESPDIEWLIHALSIQLCATFVILRPTNPFRSSEMIQKACQYWENEQPADSLRGMQETTKAHPEKMWEKQKDGLVKPIKEDNYYFGGEITLHQNGHEVSSLTLQPKLLQNGSINIAHRKTIDRYGNYTGKTVLPWITEGYEGLDLNTEEDWILAEALIERGLAKLEEIE